MVVGVAVAIVLAVGLVVLVVVGDDVVSVKPSCAVMKLTLAQGLRPRRLNLSAEAQSRAASSGGIASSPFQNARTVSRKRSFHSAQPGGKPPTW